MKRWIGRWLMGVAVLHTAFAVATTAPVLRTLLERGVWDSVGGDPTRSAVAWFVLFGIALFAAGQAVDALEAQGRTVPRALGATLLLVCGVGIALMPASGFWLALPAAIAALWPRRRRFG